MTRKEACAKLDEALTQFQMLGDVKECAPYGSGHINDTFRVVCRDEADEPHEYILQRINHEIFKQPWEVMENIAGVTLHLRSQIVLRGGDPERETLNIVPTLDSSDFYQDSIGCYWRVFKFIGHSTSLDAVRVPDDFYQSAVAFGNFQRLLADYPAHTLHETILNFHNTPSRYAALKQALAEDVCGRAASVRAELDFVFAREREAALLNDLLYSRQLPLRVTHNDTKLNNIMLDDTTGKGICVIDLDTVMPGLAVHDFGDSIRFGASTAAEDERDLEKVGLSLELYELYVKGYIEGCAGSLTPKELECMPLGAKMMTLECGVRFLTDYLQGDIYFKIHRDGQNLDRCRTQFKLVADMECKWQRMAEIVAQYA